MTTSTIDLSNCNVQGPKGYPLVGVLPHMRKDPLQLFLRAAADFGPIARLQLGPKTAYLLSSPDLIRCAMVENSAALIRKDLYDRLRPVLGLGLLTSNGGLWRRHRLILQSVFSPQGVINFVPAIQSALDDGVKRWEVSEISQVPIEINQEMARLTVDIIFRVIFSEGFDDEAVRDAFTYLNEATSQRLWRMTNFRSYLPLPENIRYHRALKTLDRAIADRIRDRRAKGVERADLLGRLMIIKDSETGSGLTDTEIRDQLVTFAFAGHDTTASTLAWSFYEMSRNSALADRVARDEHVSTPEGLMTILKSQRSPSIAKAVFSESMRHYPAAWFFARTVQSDFSLRGKLIKKGSMILVSPYVIHHSQEYWPEPWAFKADRFLMETVLEEAYTPFGVGQHHCIGHLLATLEATMIMGRLTRAFRFEPVDSSPVLPVPLVTLKPGRPIFIKLKSRVSRTRAA